MARRGKGVPANPYGDVYNNPFELRSHTDERRAEYQRRHQTRNVPRWLQIILLLAVLGGGGYGVYYLLNPPATRSPDAVALDFVRQVDAASQTGMLRDIVPSQRSTAETDFARPGLLCPPAGQYSHSCNTPLGSYSFDVSSIVEVANTTSSGTTAVVTPQICSGGFGCYPVPEIPCVEINGSWYVGWDKFLMANSVNP